MTKAANLSALGSNVTTAGNISSASTLTLQTNSTTAVTIDTSQNVGIGTTSPATKLDVLGAKNSSIVSISASLSTVGGGAFVDYSELLFKNTAATNGDSSIRSYSNLWSSTGSNLAFFTNGASALTERMRIDSSGNVGIGTTSPGAKLDVSNSLNSDLTIRTYNPNSGSSARSLTIFGNDTNANSAALILNSSTNTAMGGANSFNIYQGIAAPITFQTAAAERMRITSTGGVNIGTYTSDPGANNLSVYGNITVSKSNVTGGGITIADDGDIADMNNGYCAMRFSHGVQIYSGNASGSPVITLGSDGTISSSSVAFDQIGTYAWLAYAAVSTATIVAGTNYAGSGLRPFGYTGTSTGAASGGTLPATTPSGTWKAMGNVATATSLIKHTLYLRVA
jgi:hypothetical protein